MATLEEIGQLGGHEKEAARMYAERQREGNRRLRLALPLQDLLDGRERMAFLQGLAWERERWRAALAAVIPQGVYAGTETLSAVALVGLVEEHLGLRADTVRCPHGYRLADLRDGTSSCAAGCR